MRLFMNYSKLLSGLLILNLLVIPFSYSMDNPKGQVAFNAAVKMAIDNSDNKGLEELLNNASKHLSTSDYGEWRSSGIFEKRLYCEAICDKKVDKYDIFYFPMLLTCISFFYKFDNFFDILFRGAAVGAVFTNIYKLSSVFKSIKSYNLIKHKIEQIEKAQTSDEELA